MSFDELIFERGTRTVLGGWYQKVKTLLSNDQIQYRLPGQIHADRTPGMMACQTRWPSLVECAVACTDAIRTIPDLTPCERGSEIGHAVLRCPGDGGTARSTQHPGVSRGPAFTKIAAAGNLSAIRWLGRHRLCSSAWGRPQLGRSGARGGCERGESNSHALSGTGS